MFFLPFLVIAAQRLTPCVLAAATASSLYYVIEVQNTCTDVQDVVDDVAKRASEEGADFHLRYVFDSEFFRGFSCEWWSPETRQSSQTVVDQLLEHAGILQVWPMLGSESQRTFAQAASIRNTRRARTDSMLGNQPPFKSMPMLRDVASSNSRSNGNGDVFPPHAMTHVDKLHAEGIKGHGVTIAVLGDCFDYKRDVFGNSIGAGNKITYAHNWKSGSSDVYCTCSDHSDEVLGVVAANPTSFNIVGIAPEASIELHAITDCFGSLAEDTEIQYVTEIAKRDVDVITYSYGEDETAWPNNPTSVLWSRIQASGKFVAISAGNLGGQAFSVLTPADGIGVPAVGSVYNTVKPYIRLNGTYSVDGVVSPMLFTAWYYYPDPGGPSQFPPNLKVWTPSVINVTDNPGTRNFGQPSCQEITVPLPDIEDTIFLMDYAACFNLNGVFVPSYAKYMLFYSARALPGISSWDSDSGNGNFTGAGTTDYETAKALVEAMEAGKEVRVTLATGSAFEVTYHELPDPIAGGRLSQESGWGPTLDSRVGISFVAPGDRILMIGHRATGGFATAKGTSFAAPFAAGCAALIKQVHPDWTSDKIRAVLSLTAKPVPHNDYSDRDFGYLAPAQAQGGGLLDCYAAAHTTTYINESSLSFNTTRHPRQIVSFLVTSDASTAVSYSLHHVPAGSFYAFPNASQLATGVTNSIFSLPELMFESYAEVSITPATITVPPGGSVEVSVSLVSRPNNVDTSLVPIYGGYITLNATDGPPEAQFDYSVPYTGIATELYNIRVITDIVVEAISAEDESISLGPVETNGHVFNLTYNGPGNVTGDSYPGYSCEHTFESAHTMFEMLNYSTNQTVTTEEYASSVYTSPWAWDGTNDDNKFVPAGKYFSRATFLRIEGEWNNPQDYVVKETGWFEIRYTSESASFPSS